MRTQPAAIDELNHGEQFFELVFERSASEYETRSGSSIV